MRAYEKCEFANMCMIYDGNGNVVVQNRIKSDWPGITFPGGHVEHGESFTDAVIREVFEETGLTVSDLSLCGIKDWIQADGSRYVGLLYKTCTYSGELISSNEGKVFWTPISEMMKMPLADGMDRMLRLFLEDNLSEQFFFKKDGEWIEELK